MGQFWTLATSLVMASIAQTIAAGGGQGGRPDRERRAEDTRDPETGETAPPDPSNTDAWFTAYAPAKKPELAVAVMLVRAGSGGAVAAPAARVVLDAAL
jgi:hypothetical protein